MYYCLITKINYETTVDWVEKVRATEGTQRQGRLGKNKLHISKFMFLIFVSQYLVKTKWPTEHKNLHNK